jgi:hypothetical protein
MVLLSVKSQEEALKIKEEFEASILSLDEVTGVDIRQESQKDSKISKPVILVYVTNKKEVMDKNLLPSDVQGIPVRVEERTFVLH